MLSSAVDMECLVLYGHSNTVHIRNMISFDRLISIYLINVKKVNQFNVLINYINRQKMGMSSFIHLFYITIICKPVFGDIFHNK